MPSTRHISKEQPSPKLSKQLDRFAFPNSSHLLVTTPSQICAWDSNGIHTVFKSSKSSIVAVREAKDGSGVLAVADKQIVVLHDTKRGQERSWGLRADDDEVRYIEYATDAKSLFLSTSLTADIQRYSTERSKLLAPSKAHASPPVALAVSPTGHLLVSASDNPPVVYVKDLKQNSAPTLVEPRASETAVVRIRFHPERPNVFLLAFRDGTVACFDATKISRNRDGSFANQRGVNSGELSHLSNLHRATAESPHLHCISDAAFSPGYKTRAITAGSDGRCRLIDFAEGGVVLRTWHAKAPVTSISILSQKSEAAQPKANTINQASHTIGGPTSTDNLIAVGRADGEVHIYDTLGLLLEQQKFSKDGEKLISVEWARGDSPKPISDSIISTNAGHQSANLKSATIANEVSETGISSQLKSYPRQRRETTFEHVGLPPALRKPKGTVVEGGAQPARRFTIHPDEVEEGTVRHNPASRQINPAPVAGASYLDLFSPVKPHEETVYGSPAKRMASPPRSRPRVSPQTFVKSPEAAPAGQHNTIAKPRNLALFPSTASSSDTPRPSAKLSSGKLSDQNQDHISPTTQGKKITFKPSSQKRPRRTSPYRISKPSPNHNAKLLADLRRLNAVHPAHRNNSTLSAFAAPKPAVEHKEQGSTTKENALRLFRRPVNHIETSLDSMKALKLYEHVHHKANWPADSNQDSSLDGDIWLTSESEDNTPNRRRRRLHQAVRPPARQTSRSRVDSKGTISTLAPKPADLNVQAASDRPVLDGSTDEGMQTARSHLSPSGTFSPSSKDIHDLFPRTSSLSPKKDRRSRHRRETSPERPHRPLREVSLNSVVSKKPKSPWARAKAGQHSDGSELKPSDKLKNHDITRAEAQPHCEICLPTQSRVHELEGELARLKGEVIALKAVLRRNGIPVSLVKR